MAKQKNKPKGKIQSVLSRHDSIGAADALDDHQYLDACFVDTGDLEALRDCQNPRQILVGRTGSGKSALIQHLASTEDNVITINPEQLSLGYIVNSDILQYFESIGVKLDVFYQLLWRHILTVELLKHRFSITNTDSQRKFLSKLRDVFDRDRSKEQAIQYLQDWGEQFWQETEYRVRTFAETLENQLTAETGVTADVIHASATGSTTSAVTQEGEVIHRAQKVVNDVQIKDLAKVMDLLRDDIFTDPQRKYFITIDRLDEHWAPSPVRYKLIRALIESVKEFQRLRPVKVVPSTRINLLEEVYSHTRDSGFQEEKYASLYLRVSWTKPQLISLLDQRIGALARQRGLAGVGSLNSLLPDKIDGESSTDYIISRTMLRPRDAILFINEAISRSEGRPAITKDAVRKAELDYSCERLRSIEDEWGSIYPNLSMHASMLRGMPHSFKVERIDDDFLNHYLIESLDHNKLHNEHEDSIYQAIDAYSGSSTNLRTVRNTILQAFYSVGLVGLKVSTQQPIKWSYTDDRNIAEGELKPSATIRVHKMFWRALDIKRGA